MRVQPFQTTKEQQCAVREVSLSCLTKEGLPHLIWWELLRLERRAFLFGALGVACRREDSNETTRSFAKRSTKTHEGKR
jgi:hypothetical protein